MSLRRRWLAKEKTRTRWGVAMDLQGIALFVFVGLCTLAALAAIGSGVGALLALARIERVERRQAHPRTDFLAKLMRGMTGGAVRNIGDIHEMYRSFFGVSILRSSHLQEIAEFLQRAGTRIEPAEDGPSTDAGQLLQELVAANQRVLDIDRMCVPFSGTPEPERELLEEVLHLPPEDKIKTTAKLEAMAKAIRFRQDTIDHLRQKSTRAVWLARWGWYAALTLAALSILLGLIAIGF